MKSKSLLIIASLLIGGNAISQTKKIDKMKQEQNDNYTFKLSEKVSRQKVTFKNRYGITLTGDLYLPKNTGSKPLAAIALWCS